jgi:hypothetical protein
VKARLNHWLNSTFMYNYGVIYAGHLEHRWLHTRGRRSPSYIIGFTVFGRSYLVMPLFHLGEWRKRVPCMLRGFHGQRVPANPETHDGGFHCERCGTPVWAHYAPTRS